MKYLILFTVFVASLFTYADETYGVFENTFEYSSASGADLEKIKNSTVAIISEEKMRADKLFKLGEQYRFCSRENFAEQSLWSNCSGTLIADDVILTAGHCVLNEAQCKTLNFVFNYLTDTDILRLKADASQVYRCKKLIYSSKPVPSQQLKDYALVQLDRKVIGREVISLSAQQLAKKDSIFSVGHPLGLPMKVSKGFTTPEDADDNLKNTKRDFYKTKMLTHAGLSGAGVYNSNLALVGVLVRGDAGMQADDGRCTRMRSCEASDCPWAEVQKLETENIQKYLKK